MGGLYYADAGGVVTRYGEGLTTNGIVLTEDEKRLFVTNGPVIAAFDVQKDGALTSQREFVKLDGCAGFQGPCTGDGSTFDTAGRLYVTSQAGVQVIAPDGKYLGLIPTPRAIISVAFSGTDRKTLYVVSRDNGSNKDWIVGIDTVAQGSKGRGK
jgi:gluconolactonase